MLGVLGVLLTEKGKLIQKEMHTHLYMHTLLDIEQEPPGSLAEYPALYYLLQLSLDTHRPVLYCHTKGAFNQIPPTPNRPHRISMLDVKPENASDTDWQPTVRKMWYHEFGTSRLHDYLNIVDTKQPTVACPFTGRNKATWQNGFIINYYAAIELNKIFKIASSRYWYEIMFKDCPNVAVKGLIYNDIDFPMTDSRFKMYKSIWSFYEP